MKTKEFLAILSALPKKGWKAQIIPTPLSQYKEIRLKRPGGHGFAYCPITAVLSSTFRQYENALNGVGRAVRKLGLNDLQHERIVNAADDLVAPRNGLRAALKKALGLR